MHVPSETGGGGSTPPPGARHNRSPRETDVSRRIRRLGGGELPDFAIQALGAIDAVHTDGSLPVILLDEVTLAGGTQAQFHYGSRQLIEVDPAKRSPRFAVVHEVGHAIDYAFGNGRFASSVIDNHELQEWREAVYQSDCYLHLLDHADSITTLADATFFAKALLDVELWARSYAQYIATRSDDPDLLSALRARQRGYDPVEVQLQWEDEDFEPIAEAIDRYFRMRQWIR